MNIYRLLIFIFILFLSFNNISAQSKKYIGTWKVETHSTTVGKLTIMPNKKFKYYEKTKQTENFSSGVWKIENNVLVLTSVMPSECFYTNNFSYLCPEIMARKKMQQGKTISNCNPKIISKFFTRFDDEKFSRKGNFLLYQINEMQIVRKKVNFIKYTNEIIKTKYC